MPGAALLAAGLKLDLNSASLDELLLIPHMRPEIAASIIEKRREKAWEQVDDLIEIRGVGLKTAQKLQDYLEISAHNGR
jgi:competence protein ComEA